ncbi:hypothetical protein KC19_VG338600 [Ceratodon purpureus]|uniref:AP2/ERF domain-containing protein n=1 Tax=Ceratodon purpureus TaxID=3225 RepID=A0A8T0HX95_CERPU|nr:hypothetical protein KC19_VG338600 [Ceratodon purpureus]
MPDRETYQLEERLEALVRFSAPGEVGNGFHDFDLLDVPVIGAIRGGRRRKNPRTGGVLFPRDSKASWAVNIRPKNWGNRDKIWLGKLKCMEEAQRIADIIFYYLGCEPAHFLFPSAGEHPPPFLNDNLRTLDSVEKRMRYVKRIAKGDEFQFLRKQFMDAVKEMVKHLTAQQDAMSVDTPTDTCNIMDSPFSAPCAMADPISASWDIRSPPELGVERFNETCGRRGLYDSFPGLSQGKETISFVVHLLMCKIFPL